MEEKPNPPTLRKVELATDGARILIMKDETLSTLEFAAILQGALQQKMQGLQTPPQG